MAALFGMIANMCGLRSRRKGLPIEESSGSKDNKTQETTTSHPTMTSTSLSPPPSIIPPTNNTSTTNESEDITDKPLPPPPAATFGENNIPILNNKRSPPPHIDKSSSLHTYISKSASTRRKLSTSISMMRLPRGKSVKHREKGIIIEDHNYHHIHLRHKDKKLKHEDSLWTKKILLGEKCRVPIEDEDTILYDENGNRISSFSSKTAQSSNIPFSRSYSSIDQISTTSQGELKLRKEDDKSPDDQVSGSSHGGKSRIDHDDKSSDDG